jgi:hypothetical protein
MTIFILDREETLTTGVVGELISNTKPGTNLVRGKRLKMADELNMGASGGHTAAVSLSVSNSGISREEFWISRHRVDVVLSTADTKTLCSEPGHVKGSLILLRDGVKLGS